MGFIFMDTEGMMGAAAVTEGLAAETAGLAGPAAAAGAVVPPGLDEISVANAARITEHTAQVAVMLGLGAVVKGSYGASVGMSAAVTTVTDLASQAAMLAVTL